MGDIINIEKEYTNLDEKIIFKISTEIVDKKLTFNIRFLYDWNNDIFSINSSFDNENEDKDYIYNINFEDFKNNYGVSFIEGFIRFLSGNTTDNIEDITQTYIAPLPESMYRFCNFYYIEQYQDSFVVGKETAVGEIRVVFCINDDSIEEYEYETKNDEFILALQQFLKKFKEKYNDIKEEDEEIINETIDLKIGKIEVNNKEIKIYYNNEDINEINNIPVDAKYYNAMVIPIRTLTDKINILKDSNICYIYTTYFDTFKLTFKNKDDLKKFVDIVNKVRY